METEKNNENGEETTSEQKGELSIGGGKTTKIDVEGGEIPGELDAYTDNFIKKYKATTTRWLVSMLIGILGGSFLIHYGVMTWLAAQNKTAAMEVVERTFSAWLPIISGLAGAGVTYFFTRERNERR